MGTGFREVREAPVAAVELWALVRLLDAEGAARQRFARQLQGAVAAPAFSLLEQRDVDLGREHVVRAAHVARAAERIVVGVQRGTARLHTTRRCDHPIAVGEALTTLGRLRPTGCPAHWASLLPAGCRTSRPGARPNTRHPTRGAKLPDVALGETCPSQPPPCSSSKMTH